MQMYKFSISTALFFCYRSALSRTMPESEGTAVPSGVQEYVIRVSVQDPRPEGSRDRTRYINAYEWPSGVSRPGYGLGFVNESSKALRITPKKVSDDQYEFEASFAGTPPIHGFLAVEEENDWSRHLPFYVASKAEILSKISGGKKLSYQNWRFGTEVTQSLRINIPGSGWSSGRSTLARVDNTKPGGAEAAVVGNWIPMELFLEKVTE
ncbi:hypothetical protein EJ08DRAFT_732282 [Tothia fuscella]|uniref:Uncharacterized protein n=1 Tax=Tothia fuscella TaxID=1048955 RepID=A0A9P4NUI8_9PEZI|nr:hypothetical protein EJ08DRAFT_732282 [Tothia fuscella]